MVSREKTSDLDKSVDTADNMQHRDPSRFRRWSRILNRKLSDNLLVQVTEEQMRMAMFTGKIVIEADVYGHFGQKHFEIVATKVDRAKTR